MAHPEPIQPEQSALTGEEDEDKEVTEEIVKEEEDAAEEDEAGEKVMVEEEVVVVVKDEAEEKEGEVAPAPPPPVIPSKDPERGVGGDAEDDSETESESGAVAVAPWRSGSGAGSGSGPPGQSDTETDDDDDDDDEGGDDTGGRRIVVRPPDHGGSWRIRSGERLEIRRLNTTPDAAEEPARLAITYPPRDGSPRRGKRDGGRGDVVVLLPPYDVGLVGGTGEDRVGETGGEEGGGARSNKRKRGRPKRDSATQSLRALFRSSSSLSEKDRLALKRLYARRQKQLRREQERTAGVGEVDDAAISRSAAEDIRNIPRKDWDKAFRRSSADRGPSRSGVAGMSTRGDDTPDGLAFQRLYSRRQKQLRRERARSGRGGDDESIMRSAMDDIKKIPRKDWDKAFRKHPARKPGSASPKKKTPKRTISPEKARENAAKLEKAREFMLPKINTSIAAKFV